MPMKKLPDNVQSLLSSSFHINSYKRAIEELVFNSFDSESTCIAIRFNIEGGKIQVIDNGYGIKKCDLTLLGQRYMTSKFVELSTLKSAPNKYGWRGQSLASLIEVSQSVKITTRCSKIQDTWVKTFYKGKEGEISKISVRPSRGTTVELKGFLYNLSIQKKGIDVLNEQRHVKTFLEQLSLVHSNISISLRDDSKNEIIFKLHKNRDIYQTLSSIFGIEQTNVQELKVEKNEYKVTAYIGKRNSEINKSNWIYLNGKYVYNSKLYKVVNNNLTKLLYSKNKPIKKNKRVRNISNEEDDISKNTVPFYFIFISCPYYDYDISNTPKQSVLEFKNWEQISKLLEKLTKFYVGDVNLQEVKKSNKNQIEIKVDETRDQVKNIIQKILGSNSKRLGISQMQNGIKGKQAKRKHKKKRTEISLSRVIPKNNKDVIINEDAFPNPVEKHLSSMKILPQDFSVNKYKVTKNAYNINNDITSHNKLHVLQEEIINEHQKDKCEENLQVNNFNANKFNSMLQVTNKKHDKSTLIETEKIPNKKKRKQKIFVNKSVQHSNVIKGNKNLSIQKKVNEIIIHDYIPLPPKLNARHIDKQVWKKIKNKPFQSTYDLVQTILNSQLEYNTDIENYRPYEENHQSYRNYYREAEDYIVPNINSRQQKNYTVINCTPMDQYNNISKLTYQSHNYLQTRKASTATNGNVPSYNTPNRKHFISKLSRDNFNVSIDKISNNKQYLHRKKYMTKSIDKQLDTRTTIPCDKNLFAFNINNDLQEPSLDIQFSETEHCNFYDRPIGKNKLDFLDLFPKHINTLQTKDKVQFTESLIPNDNTDRYYQGISKKNGSSYDYQETYARTLEKGMHNEIWSNRISSGNVANNRSENCSDFRATYNLHKSKSDVTRNSQKSSNNYYFNAHNGENKNCLNGTYTVHKSVSDVVLNSKSIYNNSEENIVSINDNLNRNDLNIVFVSKSQNSDTEMAPDKHIEPLNVCEAILDDGLMYEGEFEYSFNANMWNDSLFNCDFNVTKINDSKNICGINSQYSLSRDPRICNGQNSNFNNNMLPSKTTEIINENTHENNKMVENNIFSLENIITEKDKGDDFRRESLSKHVEDLQHHPKFISKDAIDIVNANKFNFKNRLRLLPKGMSPIFENCNSKNACDYNVEEEYFDNSIYDNFAIDVQVNSEVFEPRIRNIKDLATKHIERVSDRLNKDNASLIFNGQSLKQAKILGQVDDKFIAAILVGKSNTAEDLFEALVLFDQHAVHERIRLEGNLSEFLKGEVWNSITLDNNISLKLTKDEVLYLHNYKDKFTQLGLIWDISNSYEISISAIPEAILGKNPRQVEVVMKSVKNLILEEINILRSQRGCISLYPKSIMDLVFSEACRYAIKFGDKLSKNDCIELLQNLSDCKTPFQCAHGRPAMAVITDIKHNEHQYKVDNTKLWQFKVNY